MASKIEWTDVTDNIIVVEGGGWWCRRISPGCDHCYAERLNQNPFFGGNGLPYRGAPPKLNLRQDVIDRWSRQTKPKKHFVASMTDVCGEWVTREMVCRYLDGMLAAPKQTFQVLTKRPDAMLLEFRFWLYSRGLKTPPANIWCGVTVEDQEWADKRKSYIRQLSEMGFTTFASYEPALGPINWDGWQFIDQIIAGGESGSEARPAHPEWFRATRDWCVKNRKAFFFKQWGQWCPANETNAKARVKKSVHSQTVDNVLTAMICVKDKKDAGRLLDGHEWNQFPEVAR